MKEKAMKFKLLAGAAGGVLVIITLVFSHEGHKSITTRGVMMGPKTSHLLMEPPAEKARSMSAPS